VVTEAPVQAMWVAALLCWPRSTSTGGCTIIREPPLDEGGAPAGLVADPSLFMAQVWTLSARPRELLATQDTLLLTKSLRV
jgi:hypothetical protein